MSKIIKAATGHFTERMSKINSMVIPEWGGVEIFYRPSMNFKNQGIILKLHGDGLPAEAIVMTLILKAMNKDESNMFTKADRFDLLRHVDPEVVSRIVSEMSDDDLTVEDATKN